MSKEENPFRGYDITTQAVHTGTDYDLETGAVRRPLHMANSFKLPDDLSQVNYSSTDLLMYSRNGNPNQHWPEEKIAALKVVHSREEPIPPEEDLSISCKSNCICPPGTVRRCTQRRQVPGRNAFVPSVAGLIPAGEVIKDLTGFGGRK